MEENMLKKELEIKEATLAFTEEHNKLEKLELYN